MFVQGDKKFQFTTYSVNLPCYSGMEFQIQVLPDTGTSTKGVRSILLNQIFSFKEF
jgi:hypothetical protein